MHVMNAHMMHALMHKKLVQFVNIHLIDLNNEF